MIATGARRRVHRRPAAGRRNSRTTQDAERSQGARQPSTVTGIRARHRGRHRGQEGLHVDRRGDLGRRHRQAARHHHRRIDRAPARPGRAARRRPRPGHQRPRPVAATSPPRCSTAARGQHRRQPQRRIRPVPVRTDQRRHRLQDAGRRRSSARACRARSTCAPCARWTSTSRCIAVSARGQQNSLGSAANADGDRQPHQRQLHRPVRRPHPRHRDRLLASRIRRSRKTRPACTSRGKHRR